MVQEHYASILAKSESAFQNLTRDGDLYTQFVAAHNDASDLDALHKLIEGRPEESMYRLAVLEYQHALYAVALAQYRQAHVSLRLFFELSLCSVLFSAHEIDTHLWIKGKKDANWSAIISNESGVFSKNFVGAFFEEMKEHSEQYLAMAKAVYRECSEFVHGNRASFEGLDSEIKFNKEVLGSWLDRADTARLLVKISFLSRYLPHTRPENIKDFEQMAMDNFGDLAPIQSFFSSGLK